MRDAMTAVSKRKSTCSIFKDAYRFAATGIAMAFVACLLSTSAQAYDPNDFFNFGAPPGHRDPTERNYARWWQSNPAKGHPTLSPSNIAATKRAIARYEKIVKAGGWQPLPNRKLETGMNGDFVLQLRKRLEMSGDAQSGSWAPKQFDYYLEQAVQRFQKSNGLAPSGVVDKRTRAALNVPANARLKQLKLGLRRIKQYTKRTKSGSYVAVNIPAAQIEAVQSDRIVTRHAGVVGKIDRKTPVLTSKIHALNFNPVWRLPPTVINKDLIPKGRQMQKGGKSVLVKYGIDAYDGSGKKVDPKSINWNSGRPHSLSYRQKPGKGNPMGFLKINFHNAHSVYMHDTPKSFIFGRQFRAASSGCVRVLNIEQLAAWILKGQPGWSLSAVQSLKASGKRRDVKLKRPVRLFFTYITAWATKDGSIHFRPDLYKRDGVGDLASAY